MSLEVSMLGIRKWNSHLKNPAGKNCDSMNKPDKWQWPCLKFQTFCPAKWKGAEWIVSQ